MVPTSSKPQILCKAQDSSSEGTASSDSTFESTEADPYATFWLLHGNPRPLISSSIPIENTESITIAYEFFKHIWIPVKEKSLKSSTLNVFRARCQVALQDEMLFEQMMAYSLLMQNMDKPPKQRMTASILKHSNRSLMRLRQRLQSSTSDAYLNDAVIQTIVLLIALHHTCADFEPLSFHLQALHELINLSVGKRKLEWNGFVEHEVNLLDIDWNTSVALYQPVQKHEQYSLTYPDYPFSSTTCHTITKFPPGFCELALRCKLSLQFMQVLEGVLDIFHARDISKKVSSAHGTIDDLVTNPEISMLERVLAVALLVCCLSAIYAQGDIPPIVALSIQAHARSFPTGRTISDGDSLEEKALDWAALALHSNTEEGSIAGTWANRRIHLTPEGYLTGSYQYLLLGRNLYNIVGIICSVLTPYMLNPGAWNWDNYTAFFWAAICFLCIIYTYFRVPEPRGRTFAELDLLFERRVSARKFASTNVDVFDETFDGSVINDIYRKQSVTYNEKAFDS